MRFLTFGSWEAWLAFASATAFAFWFLLLSQQGADRLRRRLASDLLGRMKSGWRLDDQEMAILLRAARRESIGDSPLQLPPVKVTTVELVEEMAALELKQMSLWSGEDHLESEKGRAVLNELISRLPKNLSQQPVSPSPPYRFLQGTLAAVVGLFAVNQVPEVDRFINEAGGSASGEVLLSGLPSLLIGIFSARSGEPTQSRTRRRKDQ